MRVNRRYDRYSSRWHPSANERDAPFYVYLAVAVTSCLFLLSACAASQTSLARGPAPVSLTAGVGEQVVDGVGSTVCGSEDAPSREAAVRAALANAVSRAAAMYGELPSGQLADGAGFVTAHRVDRYWSSEGQCFAAVQAVVQTARLQSLARSQTRETLQALDRPKIAFAIQSYRILPEHGVTSRRATAEPIDALQQELISRGFDVVRSVGARKGALAEGGERVLAIDSSEREQIATAARKERVTFLVQGEIKVSDQGQQADGTYLAVVDGSVEAVDLRTNAVLGSFIDSATAEHRASSAAYTKAIAAYARSAAATLAPQMLDSWNHTSSSR